MNRWDEKIRSNAPHPPLKIRGGRGSYIQGLLAVTLFLFASCGLISDPAPKSEGVTDVFVEPDNPMASESVAATVEFNAVRGDTLFKSIPITNSQSDQVIVNSIAFENNVCGDFFLYDIIKADGGLLFNGEGTVQFAIPAGVTIRIRVGFSPRSCGITEYEASLALTYIAGGITNRLIIGLKPVVEESTEPVECDEDPFAFNYEPVVVTGSRPEPGDYYIQVDRMRSYIYPTFVAGSANLVGTDIDLDPSIFQKPFLKITVKDAEGNFTFNQITECQKFVIPSSVDDTNFCGANTTMTTSADITGTIQTDGQMAVDGLLATLNTTNIPLTPTCALVRDENGRFRVSLEADLMSGETDEDEFLGSVRGNPRFTDGLLNIFDTDGDGLFSLIGAPLSEGHVTLVGRGAFTNSTNMFIGSGAAKLGLIDNPPAYIYIQIEATLMRRLE